MPKKLIDAFYESLDYAAFTAGTKNKITEKCLLIGSFVRNHYRRIIDIVCLIFTALTFVCQGLTWWGLMFGLFLLASFSSPAVMGMLLLAAGVIKIFIRLCIWFCIYAAVSCSLYLFGWYEPDLGWK